MNWTRYSGYYLMATGVMHNVIGLMFGWSILAGMHREGWWNTMEAGGDVDFARSAIVWFLVLGFFWILMGYLMQQWLRHTARPLPASLGWGLIAAGLVVAIIVPASGAWLVIPQGLLILLPHSGSPPVAHREAH